MPILQNVPLIKSRKLIETIPRSIVHLHELVYFDNHQKQQKGFRIRHVKKDILLKMI